MKKSDTHIVLQTEDLEIGYQKKKRVTAVASDINIKVKTGQLVAVIGVNGVGKSTFLRTLSGIQPPLQGKIRIQGSDRTQLAADNLASQISLVLTEQPISKNLGVAELIALGRQPYTNWLGSLTPEDRHQVNRAIDLVNIGGIRHKKCHELSDGQLQKVLIARALAQNTPIMILDEPTSHLDMYHKAQVLKLLKQLSTETGKAVVFATHEINLALDLCDQVILMQKERVVQGSPDELLEKKVLETVFPSDLVFFDPVTRSFRIKT